MGCLHTSLILNFILFLIVFNTSFGGSHSVLIEGFEGYNFTKLLWRSNSKDPCNNSTGDKTHLVKSIRTDTCFIAYSSPDCKSFWSEKYTPGEIHLTVLCRMNGISSFHICNEEEGGNKLNLNITERFNNRSVLASYKNLCSCVNVPHYVQNMSAWSIDNHHNSLLAYYEPDCSVNKWNPEFIRAGHNYNSRTIHQLSQTDVVTNITFNIQSLGPDPNSNYFKESCFIKLFQEMRSQFVELKENFDNQTQQITELKQQVANFTQKIRADLCKILY